ncbi:MAG: TIGR00341 family protein [Actinobacteria bacterium]|nr:TIGR00341 family protein [Actinomycetota bacterium]
MNRTDTDGSLTGLREFAHLLISDGRYERSERLEILARLIPPQTRQTTIRFMFMLGLSVTIAVMGLAANSVAVVIGAMLIAPLMTPIMSFSAAVGLGLTRRAAQAAALVAVGSAASLAFAFLLSRLLPEVQLGSEILSRTSPDVRDLVVAVAAGAAGAYATAREDVSDALPGVAVAVALVPPLAVTGVLIETGNLGLARGSGLLYLTNLFAIALSALLVFLVTGVIPTIRMCFADRRVGLTVLAIGAVTVMIAIPLTSRSIDAASNSREQSALVAEVSAWLADTDLQLNGASREGTLVTVDLTGLDEPPPAYALATRLVGLVGADVEVTVRWDQRTQGSARADTPPVADPVDTAEAVIAAWVEELAAEGYSFELLEVTVDAGAVDAVLSGPYAPPTSRTLPDAVAEALGTEVSLNIRWIQEFDPSVDGELPEVRLERLVTAWVGRRPGIIVLQTAVSSPEATAISIDLACDSPPLGTGVLRQILQTAFGDETSITIRTVPISVLVDDPTPADVPALS